MLLVGGLVLSGLAGSPELSLQPEAGPEVWDYVCAPRLQLRHPELCPAYGPGAGLVELARMGLLAPRPLPIADLDPGLGYLPWDYLRATSGETTLYSSLEDAAAGGGGSGSLDSGFVYLSYFNRLESEGDTIYQTPLGYVRGGSVSAIELPASPGLAFTRTPDRPFGWIIQGGTCTSRQPGGPVDPKGQCFTRHSVVQVYDEQQVGDWVWYLIGRDRWIEQRNLGIVHPDPTPPSGVDADRWVSVNLYEQTVAVYEAGQLVFATISSTGRNGFWTQPGLFQVWAKLERDDMTGGVVEPDGGNFYFLEDVPWVLYFDQARALHGTYWHSRFGTPTSRGCVNLAPQDANWIFDFAEEGTWVYVWDPSGNTPTDPAVYGPGGA
jgi:hypothetical protein